MVEAIEYLASQVIVAKTLEYNDYFPLMIFFVNGKRILYALRTTVYTGFRSCIIKSKESQFQF